jgi:hypothetical protein
MERESLRWSRNLGVSLVLSLVIVAGGSYWVFAGKPRAVMPKSTAYGVQPDDLTRLAKISQIVVEGVVKEVLPAEWTTADKNAPNDLSAMVTDDSIQLRTPVLLQVTEVIKGAGVPGTLLFTLPGGTDGEVAVSSPFGRAPRTGDRILVLLSTAPKDAGPWARISPLYPQLFFRVDGETLVGPERSVSRSAVMANLLAAEEK